MSKRRKLFVTTGILFVIAVVYTLLVKYYDVAAIGPKGSEVGFSGINEVIHKMFPFNNTWYKFTKYFGLVPVLYGVFYGLQGLGQLIKTKSLKKVDKRLIYLLVFYVLVAVTFVFFEKVIINYRPVLEDGVLEASYPSTHTLIAVCFCASSLLISRYYIKDKKALKIFDNITLVLMIFLVVGRLIAGCHWLTDIMGGIVISTFLVFLYYSFIYTYKKVRD
jgi:undecaprenyl-diphosphatase